MTFAKSDLLKTARLARLAMSENELSCLEQDLNRIIGFIDQLNEVKIDGILPMTHPMETSLPLREDRVLKSIGRECISSSAGYEDGLVRVPKIIE